MCLVQCQVGVLYLVVLVVSCAVCCVLSSCGVGKTLIIIHSDEKTVVRVLHGTFEALGGRKRMPSLFASFRDFEPPEHCHGPRRGPTVAPSDCAGLLRTPQPRAREKTRGRKMKNSHVQEMSIWYISNTYILCTRFVPGTFWFQPCQTHTYQPHFERRLRSKRAPSVPQRAHTNHPWSAVGERSEPHALTSPLRSKVPCVVSSTTALLQRCSPCISQKIRLCGNL